MDVMIDLETLATDTDTVVISVGAAAFDISKSSIPSTFYMILEMQDQLNKGRKVSADTLKWWMQRSDAVQKVFHEKAKAPDTVLHTLATWIKTVCPNSKELKVWGNGPTFDISIMEHMYKMYNIKCPWSYNQIMDLRTFRRFVANNEKVLIPGNAHNALDDAMGQAAFVMKHLQPSKPSDLTPEGQAIVAKYTT